MDAFSDEDWRTFQILTDHPLEDLEGLAKLFCYDGKRSAETARLRIKRFCDKFNCIERVQILQYEWLGLTPFFVLSRTPINDHPGIIRQYRIFGTTREYLTLCVTSNLALAISQYKTTFPIVKILPPTNATRLLHQDAQLSSFTDEWLLNLKEVMVDQEIGDIVGQPDAEPTPAAIPATTDLITELGQIYLNKSPRRLNARELDLVRGYKGIFAPYFDLELPNMVDYILILKKVKDPRLFVGGFVGYFPLTELYLSQEALICRIKAPEMSFPKLNLSLFMHLQKICHPSLWMLLEDTRHFNLPALQNQI